MEPRGSQLIVPNGDKKGGTQDVAFVTARLEETIHPYICVGETYELYYDDRFHG